MSEGKLFNLLYKGAWSDLVAYTVGDVVTFNGSSYACILNGTNHSPNDETYWGLYALKGDTGAQGPQGPQGVMGPTGFSAANLDTDETFSANSDGRVPSQKAAKTYIDNSLLADISRQAIINGNCDIWQRGVTLTNAADTLQYLADRWINYHTADGGTLPVLVTSRQSLTPGDIANAFYFHRLNSDGVGVTLGTNAEGATRQRIEHGTRLLAGASKKVTISFYAKSNIASKKIGVYLKQNYGTTGSPTTAEDINGANFTLTSSWVKYTTTITLNTLVGKTFGTDNNDYLEVLFMYQWGSSLQTRVGAVAAETYRGAGNVDIAQVQICSGAVAIPFQPKSFQEELESCQRYYSKSYDYAVLPGAIDSDGSVVGIGIGVAGMPVMQVRYPERMRIPPTIIFYSPVTGTAGKFANVTGSSDYNAVALYTGDTESQAYEPTALLPIGHHVIFHWTANAEL